MPENHPDRAPGTPLWERRLIIAAAQGDRVAQTRLLVHYDALVRAAARRRYPRSADREDVEQLVRLAVVDAMRRWDRRGSFGGFAWVCAVNASSKAASRAGAQKHQVLDCALRFSPLRADDVMERHAAYASPDDDPVAKTLAREELRRVVDRAATLTEFERGAVSLSASDYSHRQIAEALHVGTRAVNNALQRARRKLNEPVAA